MIRLADADDRRVWLVSATDAGRELADQVALIDERLRTRLREGIARSERQALVKLLIRLRKNLEDSLHPERHSGTNRYQDPPTGTP